MQELKLISIGIIVGCLLGYFGYSHLQEQKINKYQERISQLEKQQNELQDKLKKLKDKETIIKDEVTNEQANKTLEEAADYWNTNYSASPGSGTSSTSK